MLSKKLNTPHSWIAWIPLFQVFNQGSMSKKGFWWMLGYFLPGIVITVFIGPIMLIYLTTVSEGIIYEIIGNGLPFVWFTTVIIALIGYMKICHGISLRTGHGKWWTLGLFFTGFIFLPVTALHYQKGDESLPRPFVSYKKGLLIFSGFSPIYIIFILFYQEYFLK